MDDCAARGVDRVRRRSKSGVAVVVIATCAVLATVTDAVATSPAVTITVATGHPTFGRSTFVNYTAPAAIRGRVTPIWARHRALAGAFLGLSCPTATLCVGTDDAGDIVFTRQPARSTSWTVRHVGSVPINQVSCPSAARCFAVDQNGDVLSSGDPTGPASTWAVTKVVGLVGLLAISCPTTVFCVATDGVGDVLVSSDPTGPASAWTKTDVAAAQLTAVSCPTTTLCVAVGGQQVVSSTDPAGGSTAWTPRVRKSEIQFLAVTCPSTKLCVAAGRAGRVFSTTTPAAGKWRSAFIEVNAIVSLACPTTRLCLAGDSAGGIASSREPTGGADTWVRGVFAPGAVGSVPAIKGLQCVSGTDCVGVTSTGESLFATNPSGIWRVALTRAMFPFKKRPTVVATTLTDGHGRYVFHVKPSVATRYSVLTKGPGPSLSSGSRKLYVLTRFGRQRVSRCTTVPICRVAFTTHFQMPPAVHAKQANDPIFFYVGVTRGSTRSPKVLRRDDQVQITRTRAGRGRYALSITFSVDVGRGSWNFVVEECTKHRESQDGFGLPGHFPCGKHRVRATAYLG